MTERDLLAAEHALGLLDGEELLEARGLEATDAGFARAVADWQERFAPLFEEIGEAAPSAETWDRIRAAIAAEGDADTVVPLRRKVGFWKGMTAAASALAASLALVVVYDATRPPTVPTPVERPTPAASVMVASLMAEDRTMVLSAAYRADDRSLMLMPGDMAAEPNRSHELWIIPADGTPRSLGVIQNEQARIAVDPAMASYFGDSATLAVSVEPPGGSPGALPTGPVIATGQLLNI